jgi:hypothetical protein
VIGHGDTKASRIESRSVANQTDLITTCCNAPTACRACLPMSEVPPNIIAAIIAKHAAGVVTIDGRIPEAVPTGDNWGRYVIVAKGSKLRFQLTTNQRWLDCGKESFRQVRSEM